MEADERERFIQGLHDVADFLARHPSAPLPQTLTVYSFAQTKDALVSLVRAFGNVDKNAEGSYYWISKQFGPIRYEVNIEREKVCAKKVVGKQLVPAYEKDVVEWTCADSLLATEAE